MGTHGGKRVNSGRPAKADELKFLEKLDKHIDQDEAIKSLKELIKDGNFNAIKLYFEYRFGKPKEVVENINMNYENGKITEEELIILNKVLESEY
tara:strand:- start:11 stop:295 length:285 start_codon:yes stop_codon:yes gene_type:complete